MHPTILLTSLLPLTLALSYKRPPTPQQPKRPLLAHRQTPPPTGPLLLSALRSSSPIHFGSINAANGRFYIGKPTSSYCPTDVVPNCPAGERTAVSFNEGGTADLNVEVPGGQQIYVLPTGALAFAPAHSEDTPSEDDGALTPFAAPASNDDPNFGFFTFGGSTWLACPLSASDTCASCTVFSNETEKGPWQIFSLAVGPGDGDVPGGSVSACIEFEGMWSFCASDCGDGVGAWEYV